VIKTFEKILKFEDAGIGFNNKILMTLVAAVKKQEAMKESRTSFIIFDL
jgi:hypothetical protein